MLTANIRLRSSRPRKAWLLELVAAVGAGLALPAVSQAQAMRAPYDPGTRVMQPRIFAEGTISTDLDESGGAFSPDGKDFYFTVLAPYTTAPRFGMICVSHFKDGRWQTPETVSFSGQYLDFAPRLSADGKKFYFTSVRPTRESKTLRYRIWVAERSGVGWSEPTPVACSHQSGEQPQCGCERQRRWRYLLCL